ncbi:MAG: ABC transporter ATP-binding protein [Solirubrobacterales bacterium]|nr:ABC transporter ATP-binding protein [Solirubrobacterales bacterium]
MLTVAGLHAGYGPMQVVDGVSFELEPGGVTALLGPNGAGKTTMLAAISGAIRRTDGEVGFEGRALPARPDAVAARGVVQVPQGRRVFAELTVRENLIVGTLALPRSAAQVEIERTLELLPRLAELIDRRAGLLSGGEQQMLAIGRALVARPRVLMIDELSLGLAPKIVAGFEPILRALADSGVTILMVEQYATFARRVADRLLVMAAGRIVYDGPVEGAGADAALSGSYLGVPAGASTAPRSPAA